MSVTVPAQEIHRRLGATGCYFLCLIHLAVRERKARISATGAYLWALGAGYIREDCYVKRPAEILSHLAENPFSITIKGPHEQPSPGAYSVARYELPTTLSVLSHFVIEGEKGEILFDPLGESSIVRRGAKCVSRRLFKKSF